MNIDSQELAVCLGLVDETATRRSIARRLVHAIGLAAAYAAALGAPTTEQEEALCGS
jgi:hypothetical protein